MVLEIEIKILEVDTEELRNKLDQVGALFVLDAIFKNTIFHGLSKSDKEYVRVRDEGDKVTVTHKHIQEGDLLTIEHEVVVDSYDDALAFLLSIGLIRKRYDEKHRIRYEVDGAYVDIDTWPGIPTYIEIEAASEQEIRNVCEKLSIRFDDRFVGDTHDVFRHYGVDPTAVTDLIFTDEQRRKLIHRSSELTD